MARTKAISLIQSGSTKADLKEISGLVIENMLSVLLGGLVSLALILLGIKKRKDTVAFGPFIVAGAFVTMIWGWELTEWFFSYVNA